MAFTATGLPGSLTISTNGVISGTIDTSASTNGVGGVYTDEGLTKYIGMGVKMILAGNDMPFLMQAATAREKHLRGLV